VGDGVRETRVGLQERLWIQYNGRDEREEVGDAGDEEVVGTGMDGVDGIRGIRLRPR
jgi:hypothetical protein